MKRPLIPLNPSDRTDGRKMRVKLIGFSLTLAVMVVPMRGLGGESSACLHRRQTWKDNGVTVALNADS